MATVHDKKSGRRRAPCSHGRCDVRPRTTHGSLRPCGDICERADGTRSVPAALRAPAITTRFLALATVWAALLPAARTEEPCPLVPAPKSYRDHGRTWPLVKADGVAIVVGRHATEPERYAAEQLQSHIERRFKRRIAVMAETDVSGSAVQVFLLGQRSTNEWIDRLCRAHKIELGAKSPGDDGFAIEMLQDGPRQVVMVGGSNPRGVVYGQDALFDLLRPAGDGVRVPLVSVRDWPSIAWRGRPHSVLQHHLVPGAMDAYARSRINFIDVRDDPRVKATLFLPPRKASMGFPAGEPIDKEPVKRVIDEAHRRGMFVYGTVSCAVVAARFPAVIRTFEELLALGVDGLWISFDDTGAGADAPEIIRRVLELGQRHGISGRKIAITPPAGDYEVIDRPFNRTCAAVPGMEQAQWLFTRVPCEADAAMARQIGLKRLPGWWHNLVEIDGGFLHNGDILCTLRADRKPAYVNIQPLANGWHKPKYPQLRDAPKVTDTALLWGVVNGWPEEYEVGALGLWAWNPQGHDWPALRTSIYRYVFGSGQAEIACRFDDQLTSLKSLFHLPPWQFEPNKGWPCRLKLPGDRARALALIDDMESTARNLSARAPGATAIDPARLESVYLEPMRTTLLYARKMTLLDYPEDWAVDFEDRITCCLDEGNLTAAEQALTEARDRLKQQLSQIADQLQGLQGISQYRAHWENRFPALDAWKKLLAQRRTVMAGRLDRVLKQEPTKLFPYKQATAEDLAALFADWKQPPAGKILAELSTADWLRGTPRWRGAFAIGPSELGGCKSLAIAYPANAPSAPGDYGEARAELPVPRSAGRLFLDALVEDTRSDNRWREYRYMQLWVNEQLAWEEDVAPDRKGHTWVTVDVSAAARAADRLKLRFRVLDKRGVGNHLSVTFLGPVRLREAK